MAENTTTGVLKTIEDIFRKNNFNQILSSKALHFKICIVLVYLTGTNRVRDSDCFRCSATHIHLLKSFRGKENLKILLFDQEGTENALRSREN